MKKTKLSAKSTHRLVWLSLLFSCAGLGLSHLDKVRANQVRQQQKIELGGLKAECEQLQRESDEHFLKGKALVAKKAWTDADFSFAKDFSAQSKRLEARNIALQRRLNEICKPGKNH